MTARIFAERWKASIKNVFKKNPYFIATVADSSDDAKDDEPEEHISSVAQQQDKEETDHHGYHQATATT